MCHKNVHILDGCSFSIGSEEGYGSQRICVACHQKKDKSAKAQNVIEMNYEDVWARKPRVKGSKYLQPNPLFNIMSETKKQTIGLLKNGNLNKNPLTSRKSLYNFQTRVHLTRLLKHWAEPMRIFLHSELIQMSNQIQ